VALSLQGVGLPLLSSYWAGGPSHLEGEELIVECDLEHLDSTLCTSRH
jgi:hypothetical protein